MKEKVAKFIIYKLVFSLTCTRVHCAKCAIIVYIQRAQNKILYYCIYTKCTTVYMQFLFSSKFMYGMLDM